MILKYTGDFDDLVKRIDKSGVKPTQMDSLGVAYRHIFYLLEDPRDFLQAMPEYKELKVAAIKTSESAFKDFGSSRITDYVDEGWIVKRLVDFLKEDDSLDVSSCEKMRIS